MKKYSINTWIWVIKDFSVFGKSITYPVGLKKIDHKAYLDHRRTVIP